MPLAMHLTRRPSGTYYYRQRIPKEISGYYDNKKELCFSLRTKEPSEAKKLSYAYSLKYADEFMKYSLILSKSFDNQTEYHEMKDTLRMISNHENVIEEHEKVQVEAKRDKNIPTFMAVWDMYLEERKPTEANILDNSVHVNRFIEIIGDKHISQYSKMDIKE